MKEEALELADFLEKNMVASVAILGDVTATYIVSTIRRLVEELDKQTKPLSDEEIEKLYEESYLPIGSQEWEFDCVVFARAIEERHGIK